MIKIKLYRSNDIMGKVKNLCNMYSNCHRLTMVDHCEKFMATRTHLFGVHLKSGCIAHVVSEVLSQHLDLKPPRGCEWKPPKSMEPQRNGVWKRVEKNVPKFGYVY